MTRLERINALVAMLKSLHRFRAILWSSNYDSSKECVADDVLRSEVADLNSQIIEGEKLLAEDMEVAP